MMRGRWVLPVGLIAGWLLAGPAPAGAAGAAGGVPAVPLEVFEARRAGSAGADRKAEGVVVGVPFPDDLAVKEIGGRPALAVKGADAYQFRTLAKWPSGNVRWAAVAFQTDCAAKKSVTGLTVVPGGGASDGKPLARENDSAITVDTGAIVVTVRKSKFNLFDSVTAGGVAVVKPGAADAIVTGSDGGAAGQFLGSADGTAAVEENGPVRCVIKATGNNRSADGKGSRMLGYIVRMTFWRGRSDVKVDYTATNDENKENKTRVTVKSINLVVPLAGPAAAVKLPKSDRESLAAKPVKDNDVVFYQARPKGDYAMGSGSEEMTWPKLGVKDDDTGFWAKRGDEELARGKADECPDLTYLNAAAENGAGFTVGVRYGRGEFPKSLSASADGVVSVGLWPAENGIGHTIAHGSHRTFELLFDFHAKPAADPAGAMYRFQYHLVGRTTVEWYNRCVREGEIYPLYHFVSRAEEEALAKQNGWKNVQADRRRGLSVWRSWYWGLGGFHNQHDFGRIGLVNFLRDEDIERAGGYFLYAENRLGYNADWSCEHGAGITDFGRNNYIGRKINFEEEHRHWYGIPLLYYTTGDQRIGDAALEYATKMRADCSSPRMYGYERFLGWANYLLAAGYDMTGDDKFRDGIRTHLATILSSAKWPVDWNRGVFGEVHEWVNVPAEPNINLHTPGLMNGYISHDCLWNARTQFSWDDPTGERLADIVEGIEWLMGRECYVEENGLVYVPSEFSLNNHPAKSVPSYKFPFECYYSVLLPLLANGEEYSPGLLAKAVKSGFAAGLREDGFTYLDHPGCQAAIYYLLHQKKDLAAGAPPDAVKDLAVEALGGGKVKLTWTSPAGAAKFQARFSPRKMVPNLNYISEKRKYEFDPKDFVNWWAAEHLQGEPAGRAAWAARPGEKQSFTSEGLRPGSYFFALRVWDAKNRRSPISDQVQVEVK